MWSALAKLGASLLDKILPNRSKTNEAQAKINEAELAGAPSSPLRLWRSFLGWVLSLLLLWEIVGRLIIIPLICPELTKELPPSCLDQILTLLMGMLGLGW